MMISSLRRKELFWFLITSVLISIALRWPMTYHETGVDSFYVHGLVNSINEFGEIRWMVNPLSLFGIYPLSYASGVPILLAEYSTMSGLTVEQTILLFSFLTGAISALTAFLLGLEIRNSAPFAFSISLLYSVCPMLLFSTQWTTGTRSMFMAILPLILWILVRLGKGFEKVSIVDKRGLIFMLIAFLFLLSMIHRLFFMMIIFVVAYYIAGRIYRLHHRWRERFAYKPKRNWYVSTTVILLPILIAWTLIILLAYYAGWLGFESYETGYLEGDSVVNVLLNYIAPIAATNGIPVSLLFPISLFIIMKNKKRSFVSIFFITSLLLILPFSGGRVYDRWLYPSILCILILLPIYMIASSKNRRRYVKIAIVAVLLTVPVNLMVVDYYNRWPESFVFHDGISTSDHAYMTALYFGNGFDGEHFTGNSEFLNGYVQSYTSSPGMLGDAINLIIYHIINGDDIDPQLNTIESILSGKGTVYSTHWQEKIYYDYATLYLYRSGPGEADDILSMYDIQMFIEDSRLNGQIIGYGGNRLYPSGGGSAPFIDGVHNTTYKIYDNGIDIIWKIG